MYRACVKIRNLIALILVVAGNLYGENIATENDITSPDGKAKVTLLMDADAPNWSVDYDGIAIIKKSALGLILEKPFNGGFELLGEKKESLDQTWKPVWGRFSKIRDHHNQLTWSLREKGELHREIDIIIRVFNDGVGVKYRLLGSGSVFVKDDNTHFSFADDFTCWSANGEHVNIGPVKLSKYKGRQFPLTVRVDQTHFCSLLEAAIYEYAPIYPKRVGKRAFKASFAKSRVKSPSETSWRVILLGRSAGDLITSTALVNLNPPLKIKDTSWIKPGLAMWDWRAWGADGKDGFKYNLDMASWRRMIDFSSEFGIKYLVLDANWYGHEFDKRSDPVTSRTYLVYQPTSKSAKLATKPAPKDWKDPIDVPALIKYAKKRDVGIILYINDVARYNYNFEKTLKTYHDWGAVGIKYGFMRGKGQKKVLDTREIVELCAKYKLYCDFHDYPVPPSGDRRTYPNYLTREFCHAQCDARRSFSASTFCKTVFTNMLAGPLDMCNGFMTLNNIEHTRPKVFKPVNSTVVAEAARVLITFSGLSIIPDTPESYRAKADLFKFIARLPMRWDETKILNSSIGHYITTARRNGDEWFIASCCDEKGKELEIPLDMLKQGVNYQATIYKDTPETHYQKNKEAYRICKITVKKGEVITAKLAPGGGHCIYITP